MAADLTNEQIEAALTALQEETPEVVVLPLPDSDSLPDLLGWGRVEAANLAEASEKEEQASPRTLQGIESEMSAQKQQLESLAELVQRWRDETLQRMTELKSVLPLKDNTGIIDLARYEQELYFLNKTVNRLAEDMDEVKQVTDKLRSVATLNGAEEGNAALDKQAPVESMNSQERLAHIASVLDELKQLNMNLKDQSEASHQMTQARILDVVERIRGLNAMVPGHDRNDRMLSDLSDALCRLEGGAQTDDDNGVHEAVIEKLMTVFSRVEEQVELQTRRIDLNEHRLEELYNDLVEQMTKLRKYLKMNLHQMAVERVKPEN